MSHDPLPPGLVEDVLLFLDLPAYPERSPAGLTSLYRHWCRMVPFDNIRKLIAVRRGDVGPLPGDDSADFFRALLDDHVGGTCWAGNGALCVLLQSLGFDAVRAVGTMMVAPDIPPNHGSVVVRFGRESYVVDASILHDFPLPVRPGEPSRIDHPAWGVSGYWQEGHFVIRWRSLDREEPLDCRIDSFEVDRARFRTQHETTRGWSPFNYELTFNVIDLGGRVGIARGKAVTIDDQGVRTATQLTDRLAFLVDRLGVTERIASQLPPDVPTPPPPGTRTARAQSEMPARDVEASTPEA